MLLDRFALVMVLLTGAMFALATVFIVITVTLRENYNERVRLQAEIDRVVVINALGEVLAATAAVQEGRKATAAEVAAAKAALALIRRRNSSILQNNPAEGRASHNWPGWVALRLGFVGLIAGLLTAAGTAYYLDLKSPGRHFHYPAGHGGGGSLRFRWFGFLRFLQYAVVVFTSFGTSDVQPVSPSARAIACGASVVGIVYVLGAIALAVSLISS